MRNNGFTLIELLVVVAIIGILAAVGVVAYSGYTSGAKTSSTKSLHNAYVKMITSEILLCEIGETKIFKNNFMPNGRLNCYQRDGSNVNFFGKDKFNDCVNGGMCNKNPFDNTKPPVKNNRTPWTSGWQDTDVGYIYSHSFSSSRYNIDVYTCFKTPCTSSDNIMSSIITVK